MKLSFYFKYRNFHSYATLFAITVAAPIYITCSTAKCEYLFSVYKKNNLLRMNFETQTVDTIWHSPKPIIELQISPSAEKILCVLYSESKKRAYSDEYNDGMPLVPRDFVILDESGKTLFETDSQLVAYSFDPSGAYLAVVIGELSRGKLPHFKARQLGILDIESGSFRWLETRTPVQSGVRFRDSYDWARQIVWAKDSSLYVVSWDDIQKVDFETGELVALGLSGGNNSPRISVSPDGRFLLWGKFYPDRAPDGDREKPFRIYSTLDWKDISEQIFETFRYSFDEYCVDGLGDFTWLGDDRAVLARRMRVKARGEEYPCSRYELEIVELNSLKSIYYEFPTETTFFIGWTTTLGSHIVMKDGAITQLSIIDSLATDNTR